MSRSVNVVVEKMHENKIHFSISGIDNYFANVLRRYAMARVPILAVDKVLFHENTTSFFDEYIAHRIGMIPISTPKNFPKNGSAKLLLDALGPKKIYSGDMVPDKGVEVAVPDIPLLSLGEDQKLRVECVAVLGIGAKHMKFQASIISYEEKDDGSYSFFCEGLYHMPLPDVLKKAVDVLISDLNELRSLVEKSEN